MLVDGVLMAELGTQWAAYSPRSGQTLMLNLEAVSLLEVLQDQPLTLAQACRVLSHEVDVPVDQIEASVGTAWQQLRAAGLLESDSDRRAALPRT